MTSDGRDLEAELVIVGSGGAGLAAAVAAAENGSNVIVLEKLGGTGGTSALAWGIFGAESPVQKRALIEARSEDLFKKAMNWAHWKTNPRLVRALIDRSGDTIGWLEEKGLEFDCLPLYPGQAPPVYHVPKGRGAELMKVLAGECKRLEVEVFTRTQAKQILTGEEGNVTGVLAVRDKEDFMITTKSVIIATGGYGGNKKLLKKYCPDYLDNMRCSGLPNKGDGLVMATQIGAATEGLGILQLGGPAIPTGLVLLKIDTEPVSRLPLMAVALEPYTIWVNKRGERFIDEVAGYNHFETANATIRQPDNVTYTLFDEKMTQSMTEQGLILSLGMPETQGKRLPGLERELRIQADKNRLKISHSWDEIAEWIGADPTVLKTTIDGYNTACDQGFDPIFAKDQRHLRPLRSAPYYAVKCQTVFLSTMGGIKINECMEVLDKQDNPIPGLYAAGVDTGGWQPDTYCAELSGSAFGFSINSGRIAGENAAKFASEEK